MECDLAVLGAGGSGLVAAVKASEDGVKKVIVLEKAKKPGGATFFASGPGVGSQGGGGRIGGAPNGVQRGQGGLGGMAGGTSGFYSWLTTKVGSKNLVKTARMERYKDLPDPSIGPGRGGTFVVDKMLEFCQKQGIQVFCETPAKRFITDARGRVTGVQADTKDGQLVVNFKACIIASGGFGRNYEKLKKYWPEEYNNKEISFFCPPGMMGDGIDMAEAIGAYIDQTKWSQSTSIDFFYKDPQHLPYSWSLDIISQFGMFVSINLDGKRWMNESVRGVSLASQPRAAAYAVGDNDTVETAGSQAVSGSGMRGMPAMMISDPNSNEARAIKRWKEDLEYEAAIDEQGAHGNHTKKANTLVELALKMDIDPVAFVETVERYNKFCETGKDLDFGKDAQYLKPIRKPPFWAIYGHRWSQCTKGLNGIAVNPKYEVLNPKGEAMPGLWATGDTCTIYGRSSTAASGSNILSTTPTPCQGSMAALTSGYDAGVHVAEYLRKNI
jgi:fumarate reductase flavoprotein subunit